MKPTKENAPAATRASFETQLNLDYKPAVAYINGFLISLSGIQK